MAKPKRTFSADPGQFSVGTAGPDQIEYDLDNLFHMFDPSTLLNDGSAGGIGPENLRSDYQVDQSQSPSSNTGRLDILLGRIANRIRAILGLADWKSDPPTTLQAVKAHMDDQAKHSGIAKINSLGIPGGQVNIIPGVGIAVSTNPTTQEIQITATGTSTPAAHASSHATGGSDPVTPASIGAETPAGAQAKVDAHAANPSAHHTRYTDAEAVAAILAADGAGSGLDADYLRGYAPGNGADNVLKLDSAGKVPLANIPDTLTGKSADKVDGCDAGTGANNVLKLDSSGLVPLANIPATLTGKSADKVDGYDASAFLLLAGGNPTGTVNFDAVSTARIVLPVGTDQYAT